MDKKKIKILTYPRTDNNGGLLFVKSAKNLFEDIFEEYDIEVLNFNILTRELKLYKLDLAIFKGKGFHNLRRHLLCREFSNDKLFDNKSRAIFSEKKLIKYISKAETDIIVTAMDVWNVNSNKEDAFPSPWWLNFHIAGAKKVALSVSAHRSKIKEFKKKNEKIKKVLSDYYYVGARDAFTYDSIRSLNIDGLTVERVPDMTFYYQINYDQSLIEKIPLLKKDKLIGTAVSDKVPGIKKLYENYRKKGYSIIGTVGYSKEADYNIGDSLNPEEWAQSIKYFDAFITDKFHGTIFSIKNNTPVLSIDKYEVKRSKIYPLLREFQLIDFSYIGINRYEDMNYKLDEIMKKSNEVKSLMKTKINKVEANLKNKALNMKSIIEGEI